MKNVKNCILVTLVLFIISCTDDRCNLETDTLLKTEFVVKDEILIQARFLNNLSVYSPEWNDSIYYSEGGSKNALSFMLSPESDTTQLVITSTKVQLNDTVNIYYNREFVFLSPECGFIVYFNIDSANSTKNNIDSLLIVKNKITTNETGHIKIYF